jgi:hypothetical protein
MTAYVKVNISDLLRKASFPSIAHKVEEDHNGRSEIGG